MIPLVKKLKINTWTMLECVIFFSIIESKISDCSIIADFKLLQSTPGFIFFFTKFKTTSGNNTNKNSEFRLTFS